MPILNVNKFEKQIQNCDILNEFSSCECWLTYHLYENYVTYRIWYPLSNKWHAHLERECEVS